MSQEKDLLAIRHGANMGKLPAEVQKTVLWHMDRLPDLYQKLETTCESRFFDEILRHVQGILTTIHVPSSMEAMTTEFQSMHERHGIPTLAIRQPVAVTVKRSRSKKVSSV